MPDDNDDQHIVLNFQPGPRSRRANGQKRPTHLKTDPQDIIASGAVVVALIFAVAMVSGWVPVGRYTIGIVACLAALAAAVKLIKARRSKASVTDLPRQRR
jgi:protein-S-isoprenylcysteine O-methyltransferase Ste14